MGYIPGSIGRISELHGTYYHEQWGFGLYFEAKVDTELLEFLRRYDKNRDGIWVATINNRVEGSIIIERGKNEQSLLPQIETLQVPVDGAL